MACLTTFIFRRVNLHFEQCGIFKHLEDHNHLLEKFYELIEIITIQGHINAQKEVSPLKILFCKINLII